MRRRLALLLVSPLLLSAGPDQEGLSPGAILEMFQLGESLVAIPRIDPEALPNVVRVIERIDLSLDSGSFQPVEPRFFCRVSGFLRVPRSAVFHFRLVSDDGSRLRIGATLVVDHDGTHGATGLEGEIALPRGEHPFTIEHFDAGGGSSLVLEWLPPGAREFSIAPPELYRHDPTAIGPTAPGVKQVAPTEGMQRSAAIARAIDLGTDWLLEQVAAERVFDEVNVKDKSAQVAFETYALIVAGVAVDHPEIIANFAHLERNLEKRQYCYGVCSEIFARDAAIAQIEEDGLLASPGIDPAQVIGNPGIGLEHRRRIARLTGGLLSSQNAEGGWHYFPSENTADISCTQFVVLALAIAGRRGVQIPPEVWSRSAHYLLSLQRDEGPVTGKRVELAPRRTRAESEPPVRRKRGGGTAVDPDAADRAITGANGLEVRAREFEYSPGHPIAMDGNRWNRVCAGTSSLLLVRENGGARLSTDERTRIEAGIRDGLGWLLENWNPFASYYGLYSLEKVADIGRIERLDGKDWYDECAKWALGQQRADGSWPNTSMWGESPRVSTAFALLVLRRATSLVTTSPIERIVVTGEGAANRSSGTLEWVYIPELDTCLHWPELVRALSRRPRRSSLKILASVVSSCEPGRKGALVPALVRIGESTTEKNSRKMIDEALESVLGHPPGDAGACLRWHADWLRATEIIESNQPPDESEVRALYHRTPNDPPSAPLREVVARAALRHGVRALIPELLHDLDAKGAGLRRVAHLGLRGFYPEGLPEFDPTAPAAQRKAQTAGIRAFVSGHGG